MSVFEISDSKVRKVPFWFSFDSKSLRRFSQEFDYYRSQGGSRSFLSLLGPIPRMFVFDIPDVEALDEATLRYKVARILCPPSARPSLDQEWCAKLAKESPGATSDPALQVEILPGHARVSEHVPKPPRTSNRPSSCAPPNSQPPRDQRDDARGTLSVTDKAIRATSSPSRALKKTTRRDRQSTAKSADLDSSSTFEPESSATVAAQAASSLAQEIPSPVPETAATVKEEVKPSITHLSSFESDVSGLSNSHGHGVTHLSLELIVTAQIPDELLVSDQLNTSRLPTLPDGGSEQMTPHSARDDVPNNMGSGSDNLVFMLTPRSTSGEHFALSNAPDLRVLSPVASSQTEITTSAFGALSPAAAATVQNELRQLFSFLSAHAPELFLSLEPLVSCVQRVPVDALSLFVPQRILSLTASLSIVTAASTLLAWTSIAVAMSIPTISVAAHGPGPPRLIFVIG